MRASALSWLLLALALSACRPAPRSDPTARRDDTAYLAAVNPTSTPAGPRGAGFDLVTISNDGQRVVINFPAVTGPEDKADGLLHVLDRLPPGAALTGSNAVLQLVAYGAGIRSNAVATKSESTPLTIYSPDGRELSRAEQNALGLKPWQRTFSSWTPDFPIVHFYFGETNRPPGYVKPVGLFDARTKASLNSGSSTRQISRGYLGDLSIEVQAWHATPLELVMDVQLDGETVREVEATPGARHDLPGGSVLFAGVWAGDANSVSSSHQNGRQQVTVGLATNDDKPGASALFVTDPPEYAVHIALLGERGKELPGSGGMSSDALQALHVRTNTDSVKRIRYTVYTNHHRVVIPIPPLAVLPAANHDVRDLFDVRIPFAEVRDQNEFRQLVSRTTQMRLNFQPLGAFPTGYFPRTYTNVTPAQLLAEYRRLLPPVYTIEIDRQKKEIRVEQSKWLRVWLVVKKRLGLK